MAGLPTLGSSNRARSVSFGTNGDTILPGSGENTRPRDGGSQRAATGSRPICPSLMYITEQHVREAVFETFRGRQRTKAVLQWKAELDANIPMQNVPQLQTLTLYKYEIRQSKGEDNWIKCLIGTPEVNKETGELTGSTLAFEFHGNYQGIIRWIRELERIYPNKEFLPIEDARVVNECGYIFEGSTNQLKYITDDTFE